MSDLFKESTINGMTLTNNFVRSATWEGMADNDGNCTQELTDMYVNLARGGIGLIISSHTYIRRDGMGSPRQLGLSDDKFIPGLRKLTDAVHQHNCPIAVELSHAGILSNPAVSGLTSLILSKVPGFPGSEGKEMSVDDIKQISKDFGDAARRAKEAGFDAIQIHGAHGFLVNQMLSPAFNKRTDAYGGSIENRTRAIIEIISSIRSNVGSAFPVLIKMNSEDLIDDGLKPEDSVSAALMIEAAGIDAIELSGGTVITGAHCPQDINTEEKEACWRKSAQLFKSKLSVPLILVGGIRSLQVCEKLHADGYADYFSLSRPLIREPGLIGRWAAGDTSRASCLSDTRCREPLMDGKGIYCVVDKDQRQEG
jgi:2,4-dienoyl-CoA reductase-like NADH-dependent reductase (Old Yellow Enzyme family)